MAKQEIENTISKENVELLKSKIKEEMSNALKKDIIIKKEDANLINKFLDKIIADLNDKN